MVIHLRNISRILRSGEFEEIDLSNADETHSIFIMDNCRYMGYAGDSEVKYADDVLGGEAVTMFVKLGGGRDSRIDVPFMIFTNHNRS